MKKILILALCIALCATTIITSTVAYLTDEEKAENVFAVGNVDIVQYEKDREGKAFEQNQSLYPIVQVENGHSLAETVAADLNGEVSLVNTARYKNYIDKIVTIENEGDSEAYVRNIIAIPTGSADAAWLEVDFLDAADNANADWTAHAKVENVTIDGVIYDLYVFNYTGTDGKLQPNDFTMPTLLGFNLSKHVNYDESVPTYFYQEPGGKRTDISVDPEENRILVATQAVQPYGFSSFTHAFTETFGEITAKNHPWADLVSSYGTVNGKSYTWNQMLDEGLVKVSSSNSKELIFIAEDVTELVLDGKQIEVVNTNHMWTAEKEASKLEKLVLGDGVASLRGHAFSNFKALKEVTISGTVDLDASGYQFLACTALETVVIKEGIAAIPKNCFYNCNNLSSINIPSTVTSIGASAFTWCESLESLVLPLPLKGTFNEIDCFKHTPAYNNGKITYA